MISFFNLSLESRSFTDEGRKFEALFRIRKERERKRGVAEKRNKEPRSFSAAIKWRAVNVKRGNAVLVSKTGEESRSKINEPKRGRGEL